MGCLAFFFFCYRWFLSAVHREQELLVGVGLHQSVADGVHGFDGVHLANSLAVYLSLILDVIAFPFQTLEKHFSTGNLAFWKR